MKSEDFQRKPITKNTLNKNKNKKMSKPYACNKMRNKKSRKSLKGIEINVQEGNQVNEDKRLYEGNEGYEVRAHEVKSILYPDIAVDLWAPCGKIMLGMLQGTLMS